MDIILSGTYPVTFKAKFSRIGVAAEADRFNPKKAPNVIAGNARTQNGRSNADNEARRVAPIARMIAKTLVLRPMNTQTASVTAVATANKNIKTVIEDILIINSSDSSILIHPPSLKSSLIPNSSANFSAEIRNAAISLPSSTIKLISPG
jgi:hypothetical protein